MSASRSLVVLLVLALGTACTTYRDQLARGQRAFEQNEHDRTLAILRDLEPDLKRLTMPEQAEYAYLRGMTDYRVGYKPDARHWLSLAKAHEDNSPGVLPADWKARVSEALDELNGIVYTQGTTGLSTSRRPEEDVKKDDAKDVKKDDAARERKKDATEHDVKKEPKKDAPSDPSTPPPSTPPPGGGSAPPPAPAPK